jgi:ArsR family transcriptional regulator
MPRVNSEDLIQVYECFCDGTRLRILNLLLASPLCVCHIEAILGGPQARISRHLGYLRRNEIVRSTRFQSWIIYSLPKKGSELLEIQLRCLQNCVREIAQFQADLKQLKGIEKHIAWIPDFLEKGKAPSQLASQKTTC